jgi:ADP-heptose:LPS heptosyltransferase
MSDSATSTHPGNSFSRILILKWGALGDFIAGTTVISAVRAHFPQARITLLSNAIGAQICPAGSLVDENLDRRAFKGIRGDLRLLKLLRQRRFDLAINLKWGSEGAAVIARLSTPVVAGASNPLLAPLYTYWIHRSKTWHLRHEYLKNLDIAAAAGISVNHPKAFVHVSHDDNIFADTFFSHNNLASHNTLLISPGASRPGKMWDWQRFADVGRRFIHEKGGNVIVSWAAKEEQLARQVIEAIGKGSYLCPRTSVPQLAAIVARSCVCLCNNSGIMHVAYAMDTPVLCINATLSWPPYGDQGYSVDAFSVENRRLYPNLVAPELVRTMADVSADEVWNVLVSKALQTD